MHEDLPETAQVIAEVIGRDKTLKLAARFAQRRGVYIPKVIPPFHPVELCVGFDDAQKLSRHFGGMNLPLANCRRVAIAERDRAIKREYKQGQKIIDLAAKYGLSKQLINYIVNKKRITVG